MHLEQIKQFAKETGEKLQGVVTTLKALRGASSANSGLAQSTYLHLDVAARELSEAAKNFKRGSLYHEADRFYPAMDREHVLWELGIAKTIIEKNTFSSVRLFASFEGICSPHYLLQAKGGGEEAAVAKAKEKKSALDLIKALDHVLRETMPPAPEVSRSSWSSITTLLSICPDKAHL